MIQFTNPQIRDSLAYNRYPAFSSRIRIQSFNVIRKKFITAVIFSVIYVQSILLIQFLSLKADDSASITFT